LARGIRYCLVSILGFGTGNKITTKSKRTFENTITGELKIGNGREVSRETIRCEAYVNRTSQIDERKLIGTIASYFNIVIAPGVRVSSSSGISILEGGGNEKFGDVATGIRELNDVKYYGLFHTKETTFGKTTERKDTNEEIFTTGNVGDATCTEVS
jgi:hypothetical protein